jgi:hypothetical protein
LLEQGRFTLGDVSCIGDLIPVLSMIELNRLEADLGLYSESSNTAANLRFGLNSDGTTRFSEVFAVIVTYVDKLPGRLQKCLVGFKLNV